MNGKNWWSTPEGVKFEQGQSENTLRVKFKKLHPDAVVPSYAKEGDAGLDLTAYRMTPTKAGIPCTPCGACRQVIQEFSSPNAVVIYKGQDGYICMPLSQHLPSAFTEFVAINQDGSSKRIQKVL